MKRLFLVLFLLLNSFYSVSADSDDINDYTLIDCVNGDNDTGVAFDSSKPYATLKEGIENTIDYINANINVVGNEETASGKVMNIKVECSFDDIFNPRIDIHYNGNGYNNNLIIEGINSNSLIISNTYFNGAATNLIFKNANFIKGYYDEYYKTKYYFMNSGGTKIINSYLSLSDNENLGRYSYYKYYRAFYRNFNNKIGVENSKIDFNITNNYRFGVPTYMKNNKLNFNNLNGTGSLNLDFYIQGSYGGYHSSYNYYNNAIFISNEIDAGGNKLSLPTNTNFINNKIVNFNSISLGQQNNFFINNYIENNDILDISTYKYMVNNIFKSGFTDTFDLKNIRRNFHEDFIESKGLGWVYSKFHYLKLFNTDITSASLYKEITGKDLVNGLGDIFITFK